MDQWSWKQSISFRRPRVQQTVCKQNLLFWRLWVWQCTRVSFFFSWHQWRRNGTVRAQELLHVLFTDIKKRDWVWWSHHISKLLIRILITTLKHIPIQSHRNRHSILIANNGKIEANICTNTKMTNVALHNIFSQLQSVLESGNSKRHSGLSRPLPEQHRELDLLARNSTQKNAQAVTRRRGENVP